MITVVSPLTVVVGLRRGSEPSSPTIGSSLRRCWQYLDANVRDILELPQPDTVEALIGFDPRRGA